MYVIPHSMGYINATIALLSMRIRFHTLAFFSPFFNDSILVKSEFQPQTFPPLSHRVPHCRPGFLKSGFDHVLALLKNKSSLLLDTSTLSLLYRALDSQVLTNDD